VLINAGSASPSNGFFNTFKLLQQSKLMGEATNTAGISDSNRPITLGYSKLTR